MNIWLFVILFFLILFVIILINLKINQEFKIETSWLAISLSPVLIWLLTTQQLSEFSGFGLAFKLKEATATPVSLKLDGDLIKPENISRDEKSGINRIESFKKNRVAAITLVVGKQGYYSNYAIQEYLIELTPLSFFKYVVFEDRSGKFKGVIWGTKLLEEMRNNNLNLVELIESEDIEKINGIMTTAVSMGSSKQMSLQLMDKTGLAELPVVNDSNRYVGVVERDKITSSIVSQLVSSNNKEN